MRLGTVLGVGALSGLLLLVGCGDDDDDTGGDEGEAETNELAATASEWQFDPNDWTIDAGEFTVEFTNAGANEHEWAVLTLDGTIETEADFTSEDQVLLEVEAIAAGESATETFTIDEPGTYQVACLIEGHFDQGMEGTLTVN